ncbi:MAG: HAMP domain-containing histidine kinase [Spirochaetia bacterium]|nr:HAMP domain-containing histidine kinase [Spirochaetia bacterium]
MKLYDNNLFQRLAFTIAVIFISIIIMAIWWQRLFDKTLGYYVSSEKTILERDIYAGMYRDSAVIARLLQDKKIRISNVCTADICIQKINASQFYEITPEYENSIYHEKKRKLHMFYWETYFLMLIVLLTIGYMIWIILREKRIQNERQEFLVMTTHELKHPVSVLSLVMESLDRDSLPQNRVKEFIAKGLLEIKTLKKSLENILKLQEISFTRMKTAEAFDLNGFLRDLMQNWEMHELNRSQRIKFQEYKLTKISSHTPQNVLQVIVNNLVENALLYSSGEILVSCAKDQRGSYIEVKDSGLGFSKEDQKKYQKMFFRSSRHDIQNIQGSGLGHYIIKKLLEKNSLHMILDSGGENKGSVFRVYVK